MMKLIAISFLFVAIPSNKHNLFANGVLECTEEEGGGFCPDDNTCCRVTTNHNNDHSSSSSSSCITSALKGGKGSCCSDDGIGNTGCGHGYRCAVENTNDGNGSGLFRYCELIPEEEEEEHNEEEEKLGHPPKKETKKLAEILPRYNLCSLPRSSLEEVHGLPVPMNSRSIMRQREGIDDSEDVPPLLAYYSNKGDITTSSSSSTSTNEGIKMAVIIIHGSARNADDYICSMSGALQHDLQNAYDPESEVLLLAPRFLAPEDGVVELTNNNNSGSGRIEHPLRWSSGDPNSSYIRWTWRYGADSIPNDYNGEGGGISSFRAVDAMVEFLVDGDRFPDLEKVVVVGHSAGGQFAHRWALTSMSPVWEDDGGDDDRVDVITNEQTSIDARFIRKRSLSSRPSSSVSIRAVASNPRSFTYINNKRFINNTFQIPSQQDLDSCPSYNDWQWGFDTNVIGSIVAPYKDAAIAHAGGLDNLVRRYARRNVLYVAGGLDIEHILGTCEDSYQGVNRFERSDLFYRSLLDHLGNGDEGEHGGSLEKYQTRMVVDDVGHDHALIFQSQAGIQAVFE